MKHTDEERLTRWIDGELDDHEVRALLDEHPELRSLKTDSRELAEQLRAEFPAEKEMPYGDFFMHQLRRRIEEEDASEEKALSLREEAQVFPLFTRLRLGAGLAFLLTLALLATWAILRPDPQSRTQIVSTYTPDPAVVANVSYSEEAEATVILLEGVAPIPDDDKVVGLFLDHYEVEAEMAVAVLSSRETGEALATLSNDVDGRPELRLLPSTEASSL